MCKIMEKLLFSVDEMLIKVQILRIDTIEMRRVVHIEVSLLFDESKFVPLYVCVRNQKFLGVSSGDYFLRIHVLISYYVVKQTDHFRLHELVDHNSLTQYGLPRPKVLVFVRHSLTP